MEDKKICGIYMIKNKANNKVYIGQSIDIYDRWNEHKNALYGNYHYNNHLQRAWNKYGEDNFKFTIILECDLDDLNTYEMYYINMYNSYNRSCGYNLTLGGEGTLGFHHSEETKKKISEANKGHKPSIEQRQAHSKRMIGENNPMYGKHLSDETKNKISESLSGVFSGNNNPRCRAIYCYELDEYFWGAKEASEKYNIDHSNIIKCCKGKQVSAGRHPITGEKLHWVYVDEMNNSFVA